MDDKPTNTTLLNVNKEECKLTVQTQSNLYATISYMFRLYIAIIRLNTEP